MLYTLKYIVIINKSKNQQIGEIIRTNDKLTKRTSKRCNTKKNKKNHRCKMLAKNFTKLENSTD